MGRCWGSHFFQHVLHSFNTDFFISRKLLTNVNKQPNKEHRPIFANSKKLSSSEGPLRCIGENEALRGWFSHIAESFMQNRKKITHTQKRLYIKKARILFTFLNNAPSFLLLRWAPSRTSRFFVRRRFTECLQNTTNVLPGACKVPFPASDWADNCQPLNLIPIMKSAKQDSSRINQGQELRLHEIVESYSLQTISKRRRKKLLGLSVRYNFEQWLVIAI